MTDDVLPRYRRYCPLCPWTLDDPVEDDDPAATAVAVAETLDRLGMSRKPLESGAETFAEAQQRIAVTHMTANMQPAERAIRVHFDEHPLQEWVAAAATLFSLRQSLDVLKETEVPSDERVFAAICAGDLTVDDGRWIRFAASIVDAFTAKETAGD